MLAALLATLSAAAAPYLAQNADTIRIAATAARLRRVSAGVNAFEAAVTTTFPGRVSELTVPITTSSVNSCWQTFPMPAVTAWTNNGPFSAYYSTTIGLWTPIGRIRDSIPSRRGAMNDSIWIEIPGVTASDARLLDFYVDGRSDSTRDTVRFHTPVNETTTVRFRVIPVALGRC